MSRAVHPCPGPSTLAPPVLAFRISLRSQVGDALKFFLFAADTWHLPVALSNCFEKTEAQGSAAGGTEMGVQKSFEFFQNRLTQFSHVPPFGICKVAAHFSFSSA